MKKILNFAFLLALLLYAMEEFQLFDEQIINGVCEQVGFIKSMRILGYVITILKVLVPAIIILKSIKNLVSDITSNKDNYADTIKLLFVRVLVGVLIFFIPTITHSVLSTINSYNSLTSSATQCGVCLSGATSSECDSAVALAKAKWQLELESTQNYVDNLDRIANQTTTPPIPTTNTTNNPTNTPNNQTTTTTNTTTNQTNNQTNPAGNQTTNSSNTTTNQIPNIPQAPTNTTITNQTPLPTTPTTNTTNSQITAPTTPTTNTTTSLTPNIPTIPTVPTTPSDRITNQTQTTITTPANITKLTYGYGCKSFVSSSSYNSSMANAILNNGRSHIGTPYKKMDCSKFVSTVLNETGLLNGRSTAAGLASKNLMRNRCVQKNDIKPGDIFFSSHYDLNKACTKNCDNRCKRWDCIMHTGIVYSVSNGKITKVLHSASHGVAVESYKGATRFNPTNGRSWLIMVARPYA